MKKQLMILVGLFCLMGVVFAQGSENYDLSWNVISGGGCEMHSASYAMQSTIGQTAIGLSSDGYRIEAGYWKYCNVPAELVVNVTTDKDIYRSGEHVNVVITVTNNGPDVTLIFPGACFADFSVIDKTGMPVYDYPLECFWHIAEVPIDHGETKVLLNDVWNQVDDYGNPVPPGTYYVDGWMVAREGSEHHEAHGALREIELTEMSWGPIARYDDNGDGWINRDELKTAIYDYLTPPIGTVISRDDLKILIYDYLAHL